MKIKMPCKLCEMALDQKVGCTHGPLPPMGLGFQGMPFVFPQLREMMLGYLLRGERASPLSCVIAAAARGQRGTRVT